MCITTNLNFDDVVIEPEKRMPSDFRDTRFKVAAVRHGHRSLVAIVAERGEGAQLGDSGRGNGDHVGRVRVIHDAASRHVACNSSRRSAARPVGGDEAGRRKHDEINLVADRSLWIHASAPPHGEHRLPTQGSTTTRLGFRSDDDGPKGSNTASKQQ
jgi:hypothetical protein